MQKSLSPDDANTIGINDVNDDLLRAATNAAATLGAVYQWVDRVRAAGGPTCISGIAACKAMIDSLEKNRKRCDDLITEPLRKAIALAKTGA